MEPKLFVLGKLGFKLDNPKIFFNRYKFLKIKEFLKTMELIKNLAGVIMFFKSSCKHLIKTEKSAKVFLI
jgi:hypothetical protein